MEQVAQRYPKDDEAQIFYAITLNVAASPADKTYANQLKGAAMLEPIFKRKPQHPGVAHYLIHLYDYPAIAKKGSRPPSATPRSRRPRRTRSTCRRTSSPASATGRSRSRRTPSPRASPSSTARRTIRLHGMDYLVYAHLQLAQDKKARAVVDEMNAVEHKVDRFAGPYALAASAARYAVERGDWKAAAELQPSRRKYRLRRRGHALRARARRRALRQSRRGQGGHRKARRAQRQAARREGCLLVGDQSTSSARSRAPGCSTPRASMTRRSRR